MKVICRTFTHKCELVKEVKKGEHGASFDRFLRDRIETMEKKLDVRWNGVRTATILDSNLMNPIGVDNEQGSM